MSEEPKDNGNGKLEPQKPADNLQPEKPKDLVLTVTLSQETGQLTVQGPGNGQMFDEPMCFWMLHKATTFIEIMNARAGQSKIITAQPSMSQQIRGMFNKHRGR